MVGRQTRVREDLPRRNMSGREQVCRSPTHTHTQDTDVSVSLVPNVVAVSLLNVVAATTLMGTDAR